MASQKSTGALSDAQRRAIRTMVVVFLTALIGSLYAALQRYDPSKGLPDWTLLKTVGVAAIGAGLAALLTFAQNHLEDLGVIPAFLKAPASSGADPVPPPPAASPPAAQQPSGGPLNPHG